MSILYRIEFGPCNQNLRSDLDVNGTPSRIRTKARYANDANPRDVRSMTMMGEVKWSMGRLMGEREWMMA